MSVKIIVKPFSNCNVIKIEITTTKKIVLKGTQVFLDFFFKTMIDDFVSQFHPGKAITSTFKCLQGKKNVYKSFRNKFFHIDQIYKKFYTHFSSSTMVILELCIELYS